MTTKELIEKMAEDETLAKKLEGCKSPEEAYEVAKQAGLTDDIESFKTIMTSVNRKIKGELSDDELDNVAGGGIFGGIFSDDEDTEMAIFKGVMIGGLVAAPIAGASSAAAAA